MKLLLATANRGKVAEYRRLLAGIPYQLVTLPEVGIAFEVAEMGTTFEENAILKARGYAAASGLLTLAEDSGLEVDALGGEPGPLSRRYPGEHASDPERLAYLLARLKEVPWERRTARFRCVIALTTPEAEPELLQGECRGFIAYEPHGMGGFGYDPVFYLPELGRCMAELTMAEKNRVSHRADAARKARVALERLLALPATPGSPGGIGLPYERRP